MNAQQFTLHLPLCWLLVLLLLLTACNAATITKPPSEVSPSVVAEEPLTSFATKPPSEVSPSVVAEQPLTSFATKPPSEVSPSVVAEDALTSFTLPEVPIRIDFPATYSLSKHDEPQSAFASYRFEPQAECAAPCLEELHIFALTLENYERWAGKGELDHQIESFHGRDYLLKRVPCPDEPCLMQDYATVLGNIMISTRLRLADESQLSQSNQLFARLRLEPAELHALLGTQETMREWLKTAWASDSEPSEVQAALQTTAWLAKEGWHQLDLNGDGREEWLLKLVEPVEKSEPRLHFTFWVVGEGGILDQLPPMFEKYPEWFTYRVFSKRDITGDGLPDVITESRMYGSNYAPSFFQLLSTHHGTISNLIRAEKRERDEDGNMLVASGHWIDPELKDMTGDGLDDLIVFADGGAGGAGAGLGRPYSQVWSWNGEAMVLTEVIWEETAYRFHILYNANHAFEKGDHETAASLYQRVIDDESLIDAISGLSEMTVQEVSDSSRQFAAFRLTLLALQRDNPAAAVTWRDWLVSKYPDAAMSQAADLLLSQWQNSQALEAACTEVDKLLKQAYKPTGPLRDMGYANPFLTADTVCPSPS